MKKEYWIHVAHVDNRLVIYLNGNTIWDSGIVHDDPQLNQYIEITEQLEHNVPHTSELIFEGFNDDYKTEDNADDLNPWHFEYRLFVRNLEDNGKLINEVDMIKPYNEKHLSNPNTRAINNSYQIVKKDREFKVISNALSQQFYR